MDDLAVAIDRETNSIEKEADGIPNQNGFDFEIGALSLPAWKVLTVRIELPTL